MNAQLELPALDAPQCAPTQRRRGQRAAAVRKAEVDHGDLLDYVAPPPAPIEAPVEPAPPPEPPAFTPRLAFGAWLLAQGDEDGPRGQLIAGARLDPSFPRRGDPQAVRGRLMKARADGEMLAAVDEAEAEWLCA